MVKQAAHVSFDRSLLVSVVAVFTHQDCSCWLPMSETRQYLFLPAVTRGSQRAFTEPFSGMGRTAVYTDDITLTQQQCQALPSSL